MPIFTPLTIDNEAFSPPTEISQEDTSSDFVELITMDNGSTRGYKSVNGLKFTYTMTWEWMPYAEWKNLFNYINAGFYHVGHVSTHYNIDNNYWIKIGEKSFDFSGGRGGVTITITQQEEPNYDDL